MMDLHAPPPLPAIRVVTKVLGSNEPFLAGSIFCPILSDMRANFPAENFLRAYPLRVGANLHTAALHREKNVHILMARQTGDQGVEMERGGSQRRGCGATRPRPGSPAKCPLIWAR